MIRLYIAIIPIFGLLIVHRADKLVRSIREKKTHEITIHSLVLGLIIAVVLILVAVIQEMDKQ